MRRITSPSGFEVELDSGKRFVGTFQATPGPARLVAAALERNDYGFISSFGWAL